MPASNAAFWGHGLQNDVLVLEHLQVQERTTLGQCLRHCSILDVLSIPRRRLATFPIKTAEPLCLSEWDEIPRTLRGHRTSY